MTAPFHPSRTSEVSPWLAPTSARSYQVAALRAAVISLVLLAGLALLILV